MTIDIKNIAGALSADELNTARNASQLRSKELVPAYSGRGLKVQKGEVIKITNIEGAQIGDLFVLNADDPSEFLSSSETRNFTFRAFPEVGQSFYTNNRRPILTLIEAPEHCRHDMSFAPCSDEMYQFLGAERGHSNCRDNYLQAISEVVGKEESVPDPINIFQNSPLEESGRFGVYESQARLGDFTKFRAEMNLLVVLTSCSWDLAVHGKPNGDKCSPLLMEVFG